MRKQWQYGTEAELVTLQDVVRATNICYLTILKYAKNGDIPSVKIGRIYRVPRSYLDEVTADHRAAESVE